MTIKEWWSKPWAKNTVFFGILAIVFFTEVGTWVQIQIAQWRLDAPEYIEAERSGESLYRYNISLQSVEGETRPLSESSGKPIFLNMWASWCVPCIAEFGGLEKLQTALPEVDLVVMNIEDSEAFENFVSDTKFELPFYRVTTPLPGELTPESIPASYILDEDGYIIYRFIGAADWSNPKVVDQIRKILE